MSRLDSTIESLGEVVPEAIRHLKAFLAYEGDNQKYYQKAKVAGVLLGSYVKVEATKTNRMAVELAASKNVQIG